MNQYKRMVNRLRRELGKAGSAKERDEKLKEIRHVVVASLAHRPCRWLRIPLPAALHRRRSRASVDHVVARNEIRRLVTRRPGNVHLVELRARLGRVNPARVLWLNE